MSDWRTDFENAPRDGTWFDVRREDCPGYDTLAQYRGGKMELASWFIRGDMLLLKNPTHWREATQ